MKFSGISIALLFATGLAFTGVATDGPNEAQSGSTSDCVDYYVFYDVDGVHSPLAAVVTVEGGSNYVLTSDAQHVGIDFYAEDGTWLAWANNVREGTVPEGAAYATVCAQDFFGPVDFVLTDIPWTYQDGF